MSKTQMREPRSPRPTAVAHTITEAPLLVTPEGDPVVESTDVYDHSDQDEIARRLEAASDFGRAPHSDDDPPGVLYFIWRETRRGHARPPSGERILGLLTLTPVTLEVSTLSRPRQSACRRRLKTLAGPHLHLVASTVKTLEQMLREAPPAADVPRPVVPPELRANIEEEMLHAWLDDSIPALGGLSPRQAAQTKEGRQAVLDLIACITRQQDREHMPSSLMSPDYRKAKTLLGL